MPRIIFVNRFYWPDEAATAQLLTDLAEALAGRGWAVTVIASRPNGETSPRTESRRGVQIERVGSTRHRRRGFAHRALDFGTFLIGALRRLRHVARPGDLVVALTDPPLLGIGVGLVARALRCRCVHWVQDIYPEIAVTLTGRRELLLFRPPRNAAWRWADACVTLGREMAAVLARSGVAPEKIEIIPNWPPAGLGAPAAGAVAAQRDTWGARGSFVVAYSGNLGRVHDLTPLLEVAQVMREEAGTLFFFIGDGAQRPSLEAEARRRNLAQVRFLPPQPRESLAASLGAGDVHLVTLRPGCEDSVFPSKLSGLAAAGRPVLFIGPTGCEAARLVEEHGFGRAFAREEVEGMVGWLRELRAQPGLRERLSAAALQFARESGGVEKSAQRWNRMLVGLSR